VNISPVFSRRYPMFRWKGKTLIIVVLTAFLLNSAVIPAMAQDPISEVTGEGMIADFLVLRPLGLVATVGGIAFFIASLPYTVWTAKRFKTAGHNLVMVPVTYTFIRPLGEFDENPEIY
jgi:uncharacterized membrane protein YhhN